MKIVKFIKWINLIKSIKWTNETQRKSQINKIMWNQMKINGNQLTSMKFNEINIKSRRTIETQGSQMEFDEHLRNSK